MKRKITYLLFSLFLAFGLNSYAQGNSGNNNGNGRGNQPPVPFGPPHPELPIDGGVSLLLFAGACYGAYRSRQNSL